MVKDDFLFFEFLVSFPLGTTSWVSEACVLVPLVPAVTPTSTGCGKFVGVVSVVDVLVVVVVELEEFLVG